MKSSLRIFSVLAVMILSLLSFAIEASAQAAASPQKPSFGEVLGSMFPMIVIVYFIFYFMVTRPQQQRQKQLQTVHDSLKKGDLVLTSSGIIARVSGVEADHFLLEIANGVKVKFVRSHVVQKVELAKHESAKTETAKD